MSYLVLISCLLNYSVIDCYSCVVLVYVMLWSSNVTIVSQYQLLWKDFHRPIYTAIATFPSQVLIGLTRVLDMEKP